jgi:hypothetical protein
VKTFGGSLDSASSIDGKAFSSPADVMQRERASLLSFKKPSAREE